MTCIVSATVIRGRSSPAMRGRALFGRELRFEDTADFSRHIDVLVEAGAPDALVQRAGDEQLFLTAVPQS